MSLYRFTLDGIVLENNPNVLTGKPNEPEGWDKIISELKRDKETRGQLLIMDLTLRFNGGTDGYNILKPNIDCQGFCSFSELIIDESCNNDNVWTTIYEGILFYTDVKEYLTPCVLECKLTDNSFFAKINNNKNIEAYVNVGRSKNDETITVAQQSPVKMFDVVTGSSVGVNTVYVFPVWSAFQFIIDYMTDGEMGFVSDYFYGATGAPLTGDGRFITITTGEQIRLGINGGATKFPFISFQKLFDEVNKKINIGFSIETDATGQKVMRIEPASYFFTQSSAVTLSGVRGIIKSVNTSELYAKLKIGSTETIEYVQNQTDFPTDIAFVGFKEESYTLTGKCNIDTELNLVSDWIIDSNVIQDVLNGNTGYDDDIFFVMADYIDAAPHALQYDVFNNAPPYFYNGFLRNAEVAVRWFGAVPNSIALYLGLGDDEFQASGIDTYAPSVQQTTATAPYAFTNISTSIYHGPLPFQDDFTPPNFDTNNNYNNINYRFTSPATGIYTMAASLPFDIQIFDPPCTIKMKGYFRVYDNLSVLQDTLLFADSGFITFSSNFLYTLNGSLLLYLPANYYVEVFIQAISTNVQHLALYLVQAGRTFSCTQAETGGGVYATYSPEDFKAYMYEFDYPLTFADFETIKANPLKQITANDGTNNIVAWILNMKYDHQQGNAKFVLTNSVLNSCE